MSYDAILEIPNVVVVSGPAGQSFLPVDDAAELVTDFGRDGDRAIIRSNGDEWLKTAGAWAATGENFWGTLLAQGAAQVDQARQAAEQAQTIADEFGDLETGVTLAQAAAQSAAQDAGQTAADRAQTSADRTQTGLDRAATGTDAGLTAADRIAIAADRAQTTLDRAATGADASQTAADRIATGLDRTATGVDAGQTAADRLATGADAAAAGLSATQAAAAVGGVTYATTAAGIAATVNGQFFIVKGDGVNTYALSYKNDAGVATLIASYPSKAALDAVFDIVREWVAFGGLLGIALKDKDGKIYAGWRQDDAILRGRLGLISNDITLTYDPVTGLTAAAITGLTAETAELVIKGRAASIVLRDANNQVFAAAMKDTGGWYVPKLEADSIDGLLAGGPADGTGYYFAVESVAGVNQIVRYDKSSGVRAQVTTLGANVAPHLSADGSKVVYKSSRTTPASEFFQPVGGGAEVPLKSDATLAPWGNSLSTINYWVGKADRPIVSQGVGGQNDDHVAARMDAIPLTCIVAGNQIPASGSVAVSAFSPNIWFHWNFTLGAFRATITGSGGEVIPGTLTYSTGTLAFVRDTAGSVVNVPNPATVHITSGKVEGATDASSAPSLFSLLNSTAILYPNYNSITQALAAGYTLADIFNREVADFARIQPLLKRFIILGDYMGQARLTAAMAPGIGTSASDAVAKQLLDATIALNAMRKAQWPQNFCDLHASLVAGGHSSQFTVLGTTYDIVDNTTLVDGTHPTSAGSTTVWTIIKAFLTSLGY
ncbi:hypothetical protein [Mesorhizobium sp. M0767]|uniref:hypothetical protein n=1 Tax=Mesorhizobium sp. M0767 TaxID=2956995 RepID=UPI003336D391